MPFKTGTKPKQTTVLYHLLLETSFCSFFCGVCLLKSNNCHTLFSLCLFFFLYTFHFISNFDFIMEVHCAYLHCAYLNTAENWSREEMLFLNYLTVFLQDSILQLRFIICINCQLVFKVVIKSWGLTAQEKLSYSFFDISRMILNFLCSEKTCMSTLKNILPSTSPCVRKGNCIKRDHRRQRMSFISIAWDFIAAFI